MDLKKEESKLKMEVSSSYDSSTFTSSSSSNSELFKLSFHSQESTNLLTTTPSAQIMENTMPNMPPGPGFVTLSRGFERRELNNGSAGEQNETVHGSLPLSTFRANPINNSFKNKALIYKENGRDYYKTKGSGVRATTSSGPIYVKKNFDSTASTSKGLRCNISESSIESITTFNVYNDSIHVAGFKISSHGISKVDESNSKSMNDDNVIVRQNIDNSLHPPLPRNYHQNNFTNNEEFACFAHEVQENPVVDLMKYCPSYLILKQNHALGGGNGGRVYKAIHLPSLMIVALKQVDTNDIKKRHQMVSELSFLYALKRDINSKAYYGISTGMHGAGAISTKEKQRQELWDSNQDNHDNFDEDTSSEGEYNNKNKNNKSNDNQNHDDSQDLISHEINLQKRHLEPFSPHGIHLPYSGIHEQILLNLERRSNSINSISNNESRKNNETGWTVHSLTPPRIRNQSITGRCTTLSKGQLFMDGISTSDQEKSGSCNEPIDWKAKDEGSHLPLSRLIENKYLNETITKQSHINNEVHSYNDTKSNQNDKESNNRKFSENDLPIESLRITISNSSPRAPFPDGTVDIINIYQEGDVDENDEELLYRDFDINLDDQSDFNLSYSPSAWSTEGKRSRNSSQAGLASMILPPELKLALADQDSMNNGDSPISTGVLSLSSGNQYSNTMKSINDPSKINQNNTPPRIRKLSERKFIRRDPMYYSQDNETGTPEDESEILNSGSELEDFESDSDCDVSLEVEEENERTNEGENTIFGDMEGYSESSRHRTSVENIKNNKSQVMLNNFRKPSGGSLSEISFNSEEGFGLNNKPISKYKNFNKKKNMDCDTKRKSSITKKLNSGVSQRAIDSSSIKKEEKVPPGLVSFYNAYKETNKSIINLVMEYMPFGSLEDILKAYQYKINSSSQLHEREREDFHNKGAIIEEVGLRNIAKDVLEGLIYLHDRNKVHRDIKPANLLVGRTGKVKIADYGLVTDVGDINFAGTLKYMSPERVKNSKYDTKADIWSFAFSLLTFALGKYPYEEINEGETEDTQFAAMISILWKKAPPIPQDKFTDRFQHFLKMSLEKDPEKRWSAKQLLRHPFILLGPGTHHDSTKMDFHKNTALAEFANFCYRDSNDSNRNLKGMEEFDIICDCLNLNLNQGETSFKIPISNDQLRNLFKEIEFPGDFENFKNKFKAKVGHVLNYIDR